MPVKFWLIKPFHFYCVCAQSHQPRFDLLLKNRVTQSETLRRQIESLQEALADGSNSHPGKCFTVHAASLGVALCASTGRHYCAAGVRKRHFEKCLLSWPWFSSLFQFSDFPLCRCWGPSFFTHCSKWFLLDKSNPHNNLFLRRVLGQRGEQIQFRSSKWVKIEGLERSLFGAWLKSPTH